MVRACLRRAIPHELGNVGREPLQLYHANRNRGQAHNTHMHVIHWTSLVLFTWNWTLFTTSSDHRICSECHKFESVHFKRKQTLSIEAGPMCLWSLKKKRNQTKRNLQILCSWFLLLILSYMGFLLEIPLLLTETLQISAWHGIEKVVVEKSFPKIQSYKAIAGHRSSSTPCSVLFSEKDGPPTHSVPTVSSVLLVAYSKPGQEKAARLYQDNGNS